MASNLPGTSQTEEGNKDSSSSFEYETNQTFKCSDCDNSYNVYGFFKLHRERVHSDVPTGKVTRLYCCPLCLKQFKTPKSRHWHLATHVPAGQSMQCPICSVSFTELSQLKVHHRDVHRKRKLVKCEICGKSVQSDRLKSHLLRLHSTERNFQCPECPKTFPSEQIMLAHKKSHEKIYHCDKCDKSFSYASVLKQHLARHAGIRKAKCEYCKKMFYSKSDMKRHVKTIHEKESKKTDKS